MRIICIYLHIVRTFVGLYSKKKKNNFFFRKGIIKLFGNVFVKAVGVTQTTPAGANGRPLHLPHTHIYI